VNLGMARLAGEVFDGFHVHPFHSRHYLAERVIPAIDDGTRAAGRETSAVELICPVFTIVGDTEEDRAPQRESVRRQLSFYGSTRTYRPVFDLHGWGDASEELHRLMAAGDTARMTEVISDEMLAEYAVTATWDDLADDLLTRYRGLVDRLFTYQPAVDWLRSPELTERWAAVAAKVRSG
jgi:alkanesulfonate monooxygenase SsuD/methylene tetrahydromethanopterin reductase-like flavin-dependent oxidoreductase (luciferase family)